MFQFDTIKNYLNFISMFLIAFVAIFIMTQCESTNSLKQSLKDKEYQLQKEKDINNQNILALNDSIRKAKDLDGDDTYEKYSLMVRNLDELRKYHEELYKASLETNGEVKNLLITTIQAKIDSLSKLNGSYSYMNDSTFVYDFGIEYSDSGLFENIKGNSIFSLKRDEKNKFLIKELSRNITKNELKMDIEFVTLMRGDTTIVSAKSKSDKISFSKLNYVEILPKTISKSYEKPARMGFGFSTGVAWNPYNTQNFGFQPYIGASINYNIILFRTKKTSKN